MALWNASLKKRDAKNACFLLAGQNLTDFEFSIHESADSEVYIACSSEREKVDWLIALDFAALSVRKSAPAPCLVKYFDALGLPKSLFGDCKVNLFLFFKKHFGLKLIQGLWQFRWDPNDKCCARD